MRVRFPSGIVLVVSLVALAGRDGLAGPLFPNPIYATGDRPESIVTTDLDRDGLPDLLVANEDSSDLSIFQGRADGTFEAETRLALGLRPQLLLHGRFDGDSYQDFAVMGTHPFTGSGTFSILLGQPDGTLLPGPLHSAKARYVLWASVGDLNDDGLDDLVFPDSTFASGFARVHLNQGAGTFASPAGVPTISSPDGAATGDFDEDGLSDIIIGGVFQIAFHRNLGGGAFGPPVPTNVGETNRVIAVADLDSDGHLDLAIEEQGMFPLVRVVNILRGDGHGGFSLSDSPATHTGVGRVACADMDGNGALDLVLAESETVFAPGPTNGFIEVLSGNGDGTFAAGRWYGAGTGVNSVAIGDFDGDGDPDVAAALLGASTTSPLVRIDGVGVFANLGDGTFDQPRIGVAGVSGLVRADFDRDGHEDLAIPHNNNGSVSVFLGHGDGTFDPEESYPAGAWAGALAIADFNGDDAPDIAVANGSTADVVTVLLGNGDGTFGPPAAYPGGEGHIDIAAADFTHDGIVDLVVTNDNTNISLLRGLGDGRFGSHQRFTTISEPRQIEVADLNDDGLPDVVVCTNDSVVRLMGAADGSLGPPVFVLSPAINPGIGLLQDVDGDGLEDLLLPSPYEEVTLLHGLPGGDFAPAERLDSCTQAHRAAAADYDRDGLLDIAFACVGSSEVAIRRGSGGGSFMPLERYATARPGDLIAADFNEDGAPDLAYGAPFAASAMFLINTNAGATGAPPLGDAGPDGVAECASTLGGPVPLDGTASSDPDSTPGTNDDIVLYEWFEGYGGPDPTLLGTGQALATVLPIGSHFVTLRVTDSGGRTDTDEVVWQVADTTPPVVAVSLAPEILWPPNHRLVPVLASVTGSDACGPLTLALVSVTSSEPDDAPHPGDGVTIGDIREAVTGTLDTHFLLRAERDSGGAGRTYTALYSATDAAGNSGSAQAAATVPLDRGGVVEPLLIHVDGGPLGSVVSWGAVSGALAFSVVRGPLDRLRGVPGAAAPVCVASQVTGLSSEGFEDASQPAVGEAFVYFVEYFDPDPSGYGTEPSPQDVDLIFPSLLCP